MSIFSKELESERRSERTDDDIVIVFVETRCCNPNDPWRDGNVVCHLVLVEPLDMQRRVFIFIDIDVLVW